MSILDVQHIEKNFGATKVLKDINFSLDEGQVLAIIGSSGSGKTTLLRCLNFLETPNTGRIVVRGETLFDAADPATQQEKEIRRKRLHFGLVFQSFNLFPQYTALENVTLAERLMAKERPDFKANKKKILAARDIDTVVTGKRLGHPVRCLKNDFSRMLAENEYKADITAEEFEQLGVGALRRAVLDGDTSGGSFMCGQIAGMVDREQTCAEIIRELFTQAEDVLGRTKIWAK